MRTLDTINPADVRKQTLYTGEEIPCVGLGTCGSKRFDDEQIEQAVYSAIKGGYRLIDCAARYGNEAFVGRAIERAFSEGVVRREELFVITKVWCDMLGRGDVLLSLAQSLKDLRLDYVDMFFIHWPFPRVIPVGASIDYRDPAGTPFLPDVYIQSWRQMERLQGIGLARNLGVSNMTISKLRAVLPQMRIRPAAIEMELHPCFQQKQLFDYCLSERILPIGFSPIGSPTRPDRDRDDDDVCDIKHPIVTALAEKYKVHPAVICIRWAVTRGQIPIPFSIYENEYMANLRCAVEPPLTPEEMRQMERAEANSRLVKAHVMLWPGADRWQALWDE